MLTIPKKKVFLGSGHWTVDSQFLRYYAVECPGGGALQYQIDTG